MPMYFGAKYIGIKDSDPKGYRTKMGNVRKMGENGIIEQQRSDKNYRTTQKNKRKIRYIFFSHLPRKTELWNNRVR